MIEKKPLLIAERVL